MPVRVPQQAQGLMFKIAELQQPPLPLFGGEAGVKIPHGGKQGPQAGQGGFAVSFGLVLTAGDQIQNLPKQGAGLIGPGLDGGLVVARQPLFHALEPRRGLHAEDVGGELIVKGRPFSRSGQPFHLAQQGGGSFQPFEGLGKLFVGRGHGFGLGGFGLFAGLRVGLGYGPVFPAVGKGRRQQFPGGLRAPGRFRQQDIVPAGFIKAVFGFPRGQKFVQLFVVVRQSAEKIVGVQNRLARRAVGAALAVQIGKGAEIRVAVGVFQRLAQSGGPQCFHTAGVGGGKVRRDVQRLKVLAQ